MSANPADSLNKLSKAALALVALLVLSNQLLVQPALMRLTNDAPVINRMPGTSGLDLFEQLVARGEGMPVIFITAYADVPMAVRAMKSGAVEFVEKPFNRQTLLDKVQRAIKAYAERHGRRAATETLSARFRRLTPKEREALEQIKDGPTRRSPHGW
jgi:FixJ family two-component response regulator